MAHEDLFAALESPNRRSRSLAALRLGRARVPGAIDALLKAAEGATDEVCSILDALGYLGDAQAIPLARTYAARKLLSRRRSGVEALRNLGDAEGMAEARARALASLEGPIQAALEGQDPADPNPDTVAKVMEAVLSLVAKRRGRAADTLYEIGQPLTVAASQMVLKKLPFDRPFVWRYAKSVFKRSMLRRDAEMFGWICHRIELRSRRSGGTHSEVKSGRDGVKRDTPIFNKHTQRWARRAAWRHLRFVAKWWPADYTAMAAEALVHYDPKDTDKAHGFYGELAQFFLLNKIVCGRSQRLEYDDRKLRFRFKASHLSTLR